MRGKCADIDDIHNCHTGAVGFPVVVVIGTVVCGGGVVSV